MPSFYKTKGRRARRRKERCRPWEPRGTHSRSATWKQAGAAVWQCRCGVWPLAVQCRCECGVAPPEVEAEGRVADGFDAAGLQVHAVRHLAREVEVEVGTIPSHFREPEPEPEPDGTDGEA